MQFSAPAKGGKATTPSNEILANIFGFSEESETADFFANLQRQNSAEAFTAGFSSDDSDFDSTGDEDSGFMSANDNENPEAYIFSQHQSTAYIHVIFFRYFP